MTTTSSSSNFFNIGYACTTQQLLNGHADKVALKFIFPDQTSVDYTFLDLDTESNKIANFLSTTLSIVEGETVLILLPKTPELFFSFLGSLKHKAITGILFSSLGESAISERIIDSNATCIITKKNFLKKINFSKELYPNLKHILLIDIDEHIDATILSYKKLLAQASTMFIVPPTSPEAPSVLHYTSGSTGKPKGVLHHHRSLALQKKTFREVLSVQENDIYWCTADQGWVTGVSYGIIGPWSNGTTQIQYAGAYTPEVWFNILESEQVNVWYTAPTALRMLMKEDEALFTNYELHHLRHISSVGEPLNPEIISWGKEVLGKDIYDTWFQTETGAIMIANRPGLPIKAGSMGKSSCNEIFPVIISDDGVPLPPKSEGNLCLVAPFSSLFSTYLHYPDIYQKKFIHSYYFSGDRAYQDEDGYLWFLGRADDIINTAGHLVSPFEVESALLEHSAVSESAVIGVSDPLLYEKVVAFVSLKSGYQPSKEVELQIRLHVSNRVSSTATPQEVYFIDDIPKNNSGKIMRRILKKQYINEDVGDTSTLMGS
ncbi:MAG: AMP-binding protein [Oligoflexia bacterium]|nr:AMP-binding protein [Oligoflexia bacterium]